MTKSFSQRVFVSLTLLLGVSLVAILASAMPAHAATFTVTTLADEDDGTPNPSVGTGTSLREAIRAANVGSNADTIVFASSVTGRILLTRALPAISTNITLQGPNAQNLTVVEDTTGQSVFVVTQGVTANISGLTLEGRGAAVTSGGGGINNSGTLVVTNCNFFLFTANEGSGISNSTAGQLTVQGCTFYGNLASRGGGGILNRGSLLLVNSTLAGNASSQSNGGGLLNSGSAVIRFCTFSGNDTAGSPASQDNGGWNVISSGGGGGGAANKPAGGAIYSSGGALAIANTILYSRSDTSYNLGSSNTSLTTGGCNISSDGSGPRAATDRRSLDAGLDSELKDNGGATPTLALLPGSPAIDAGNATNQPATDQRGIPRPQGIKNDIGAFEMARTVSGTLNLQGIAANAPVQSVDFTFRPNGGGTEILRTTDVGANGTFSLYDIPPGVYTLHVRVSRYLARNVGVDLTNGNATGVNVLMRTGDANEDNAVDITDLLALIAHYNQAAPAAGYLDSVDFNFDGKNDITDLLLLVGNYNQQGDN